MPTGKKNAALFDPEEEKNVREELRRMVLNGAYNTPASYTPISVTYPDGLMPFVDRHMKYLHTHPKLDARMYLANLQLMTRIRVASR